MAQLNIAEKRLPQDGRIRIKLAAATSTFVSRPVPSRRERIVFVCSTRARRFFDLSDIGMGKDILEQIDEIHSPSHGIILSPAPPARQDDDALRGALSHQTRPTQHSHRRRPGRVSAQGIGRWRSTRRSS